MSSPKALLGEIRRLADAVSKVRADSGTTSEALDKLDGALREFLDDVGEAGRLLSEVADLHVELNGEAWAPVWRQPEASKVLASRLAPTDLDRAREAWGDLGAQVVPMSIMLNGTVVQGFGFVLTDGSGVGPFASTEADAIRGALLAIGVKP